MKNKNRILFRQGDVLVERIPSLPSGKLVKVARENGRVILAHGEVTGHAHAIVSPKADLYSAVDKGDITFLDIQEAVDLVHDEHATVILEPGVYQVIRQREYTPQEIRRVAD